MIDAPPVSAPIIDSARHDARFDPPLDIALAYDTVQTIAAGETPERYTLRRTITFHREADGYSAVLLVRAVDGGIGSDPGAMFDATASWMVGTPITMHLNRDGDVIAVDDRAALIARMRAAIVEQVMQGPESEARRADAERLAAPLAAMPPEMQREMLGSMLSPIIASTRLPVVPSAPVALTQKGLSPFGSVAEMTGTRRAWLRADGLLIIDEQFSGTAAVPDTGRTAHIETRQSRAIDPKTRFIVDTVLEKRISDDGVTSVTTTRSTLQAPVVP